MADTHVSRGKAFSTAYFIISRFYELASISSLSGEDRQEMHPCGLKTFLFQLVYFVFILCIVNKTTLRFDLINRFSIIIDLMPFMSLIFCMVLNSVSCFHFLLLYVDDFFIFQAMLFRQLQNFFVFVVK